MRTLPGTAGHVGCEAAASLRVRAAPPQPCRCLAQSEPAYVIAATTITTAPAPPLARLLRYFFSGSGFVCGTPGTLPALTGPPGVNGNVANIDFAWFCICSCICTNMFFDCSI